MERVRLHCEPTTFQVRGDAGALVNTAADPRGARRSCDTGHLKSVSPFEMVIEQASEDLGFACLGGAFRPSSGAQVVRGGMRGFANNKAPGRWPGAFLWSG